MELVWKIIEDDKMKDNVIHSIDILAVIDWPKKKLYFVNQEDGWRNQKKKRTMENVNIYIETGDEEMQSSGW